MIRTETTSVRMLQAVSVVASLAILLWSLGLPALRFAEAASLTNVSDTLSDSSLDVGADHVIRFTLSASSTGLAAGENFSVTFADGFNIASSGVDFNDVDLLVNGSQQTLAASAASGIWGVSTTTHNLVITSNDTTLAAGDQVVLYIGTNATSGSTGTHQITNQPAAGSYAETITLPGDTGAAMVVILDNVTVSASIDTVFNFTVSGFSASGTAVNGTTTTATSSATEIPFGTLSANKIVTAAQLLNVTTNAYNGFVVTVQQSGNLQSATGADIDGFIDGAYTNTPSNWAAPSDNINDENTWGHWGLTSSDDLNSNEFFGCTASTTGGCWVAASTTPRQVFENNGPANGTTANVGSTTVGYQVEISPLQEAGDDYSTTLTYIATPTF